MRELGQSEVAFVSGGRMANEGGSGSPSTFWGWWDLIGSWIQDHLGGGGGSAGGGLTWTQQIQACQDLGRGLETVETGLIRQMYPGDDVRKVCENAVRNEQNWVNKSADAICEQVYDGVNCP